MKIAIRYYTKSKKGNTEKLAAQISKAKKVLEDKKADDDKKAKASETLAKWTAKKEAIEAEIEGRKKN